MNHPIMFLDRDKKTKLVPASFLFFRTFMTEKQILAKECVIVITLISSLHYKEINETVLFTLLRQKNELKSQIRRI